MQCLYNGLLQLKACLAILLKKSKSFYHLLHILRILKQFMHKFDIFLLISNKIVQKKHKSFCNMCKFYNRLNILRKIKASEMLVALRISECFSLPWSALICYSLLLSALVYYSLPWSAIVSLGCCWLSCYWLGCCWLGPPAIQDAGCP